MSHDSPLYSGAGENNWPIQQLEYAQCLWDPVNDGLGKENSIGFNLIILVYLQFDNIK